MDQTELHNTIHMDVHMGICICQWIYIPMNMSTCVVMFMCILWIYTHWTLLNTPHVNTKNPFVLFLFHCVIFVTPIHFTLFFIFLFHVVCSYDCAPCLNQGKYRSINQYVILFRIFHPFCYPQKHLYRGKFCISLIIRSWDKKISIFFFFGGGGGGGCSMDFHEEDFSSYICLSLKKRFVCPLYECRFL